MALPRKISPFFDLSKFTVKSSIDKPWERGRVLIYLKHIWQGEYLRGGLIEDLRKERRVKKLLFKKSHHFYE